ncbi:unnamed protein product [Prunus brigantina]
MRAELMAKFDTARYTNKSSPGIGFESRGGEVRFDGFNPANPWSTQDSVVRVTSSMTMKVYE